MMKRQKQIGSLFIFYVLLFYVVVQFAWWGYHIYALDREVLDLRKNLFQIQNGSAEALEINFSAELSKRRWMIIGEGSVFLLFLILGAFQVRRTFRKEQMLAKQQKNFLLSVTHELKSPIASVKLSLQTLLKRNLEEDQQKEVVERSLNETDRLSKLVDNILLATAIENSNYVLNKETFDLSDCVHSVVDNMVKLDMDHQLLPDITSGIMIKADKIALISILHNLIENAIKYSPAGSAVMIGLYREKGGILLSVKDEGYGIQAAEKRHIFKKFYRIENEETRKSKGTGLGLFIVKYLADQHGAELSVQKNHPQGTVFNVLFKKEERIDRPGQISA